MSRRSSVGRGALLDLVSIIEVVLDKVGAGMTTNHARAMREAHPEWFSETMVGPASRRNSEASSTPERQSP